MLSFRPRRCPGLSPFHPDGSMPPLPPAPPCFSFPLLPFPAPPHTAPPPYGRTFPVLFPQRSCILSAPGSRGPWIFSPHTAPGPGPPRCIHFRSQTAPGSGHSPEAPGPFSWYSVGIIPPIFPYLSSSSILSLQLLRPSDPVPFHPAPAQSHTARPPPDPHDAALCILLPGG